MTSEGDSPLKNVRIVLVRPIYGGNIGSVCRAMANMGLSDLVTVAPKNIRMEEAEIFACWAREILQNRREVSTLAEAVTDCAWVLGATARPGLYRQHCRTPREWAPLVLETAAANRIALVFGPEDNGLSNDDLEICTHVVRIPSTPEYSSLNLSHAVMICAYELYAAAGLFEPPLERTPEASGEHRERMFGFWRQAMLNIGFMNEDKSQHMMLGLRRVFARGRLTVDDVNILMGIARQTLWCAREMIRCRSRLIEINDEFPPHNITNKASPNED